MFKNQTIKQRLLFLTGFITFVLFLIGIVAISSVVALKSGMEDIYYGGTDAIYELNHLSNYYTENVLDPVNMLHDQHISWEKAADLMAEGEKGINKTWENYSKIEHTEQEKRLIEKLKDQMEKITIFLKDFKDILNEKNQERLSNANDKIYNLITPLRQLIVELIDMHVKVTLSDFQLETSKSDKMMLLMVITVIFGVSIAFIFAYFIIQGIVGPLTKAVEIVDDIAKGELSVNFPIHSKDEVGQLMKSMQNVVVSSKRMIHTLEQVAQGDLAVKIELRSESDSLGRAINDMASKLRSTISELQKEISVLASSSEEIVASVTQVSSGTAETAAAVTETTTTIEELKQTAHISADKAQDVLSKSEESHQVVRTSEQNVKATLDDMSQIQEKMRLISESIVKLSEHTLTIGKIIDTVNDLAEQSNLLAVNAAIEAAKAGDQGKGFSVVAQEIRALAEQSKAATIQVHSILSDIQSATNATVMATEQGSKVVLKGVEQSIQTNEAIKSYSESIQAVTQAAKQIAISSQQQLVGVDQVTTAMTNINDATTQHVEHMKQIESGIKDVNKVGKTLKELASQYKL